MQIYEKIRQLREINQLSQEEMAMKLDLSTNGYAKIERGETKLNIPRLEQIAEIFDTDIFSLIQSDTNFINQVNHGTNNGDVAYYANSQNLSAEIEKLNLIIQHKDELLEQKQSEIENLKKIISLLEK
ncbi:helix-turn-helix domain-containing protein [Wielerella bovis]|uniref:helix-turn-helix domain-containing protein n=1 Tax=Wielerella bovis TaxID=2917790 RepID=UPI00201A1EA5|nr:helix-turn-helix transcriptional regulator [Wielerella bovis]MCG7656949.1 helix-turn-helix domain-containing protein [Wielerella bovis]MCG7659172.1 helix-turn-helix domain-containing protein [Wielerella bovis]ULJ65492.1 helix-turn-helix domain-containing protein [Wielerella bovis]ULJ66464.1 helix-turn-helix domain-containing protein [Wielerella bovis]